MSRTEPSERGTLRTILLACGILSSVLYVTTDLFGGLTYEGYSFSAQTISELGAIGSPSKPFVDPLFLTYDVLVAAFGIGVMRAPIARKRALQFAGFLLVGPAERSAGRVRVAPLASPTPTRDSAMRTS